MAAAPDLIVKLEARVAALEARLSGAATMGNCPKCGAGSLRFQSETPDPTFGDLGVTRMTFACDAPGCGFTKFQQSGDT